MIKLAIVAYGAALRAGLHALLGTEPGIQITAEAAFLAELERLPEGTSVVVLAGEDNLLPSAIRAFEQFPGAGVLYLVGPNFTLPPALVQGSPPVWGLLPLDSSPEELIAAVKALSEGLTVANPLLLRPLLVKRQSGDSDKLLSAGEISLSPREVEALQQLALGLTNKQIALALGISEHTVKFHISSIYTKLDVMNRADAVRTGIARGWITL